jgi:hypothetical protein
MVQPPNPMQGLNTISSLLGIKQQQLALQTGQAGLQTAQATATTAQIGAQGQQESAQFFKDWDPTQHIDDDGTVDLGSAFSSPDFKNAGPGKPAIIDNLLKIKQGQLQNKQALAQLNNTVLGTFTSQIGALAKDKDVQADQTDPETGINAGRAKADNFLANFSKLSPDAARIAAIYKPQLDNVPQGHLAGAIAQVQMLGQSASEQQAAQYPRPTAVSAGGTTKLFNVSPSEGFSPGQQPITSVKNSLPPQVIPNPTTGGPAAIGGEYGLNPIPIQPGAPPASGAAPPTAPPGASPSGGWQPVADQKVIQAQIDSARQAGDQVPVNRDINRRILSLADQTSTGKGTEFIHQAAATAGLPTGSAYQELGAFLDRQAALASQTMGLPTTNAGLETAKQFTGNTQYNNQVIKDKTKFVDALQSATGAYRAGLDRVVGTGQTPNYGAYQAYRSAWAQNFDPQVFAYENAFKRGDKAELANIEADEGRKGMAELLQKRRTLMGLVNGQ